MKPVPSPRSHRRFTEREREPMNVPSIIRAANVIGCGVTDARTAPARVHGRPTPLAPAGVASVALVQQINATNGISVVDTPGRPGDNCGDCEKSRYERFPHAVQGRCGVPPMEQKCPEIPKRSTGRTRRAEFRCACFETPSYTGNASRQIVSRGRDLTRLTDFDRRHGSFRVTIQSNAQGNAGTGARETFRDLGSPARRALSVDGTPVNARLTGRVRESRYGRPFRCR